MDYGDWTENSRGSYNKWDAISRSTTQVRNCHAKFKRVTWWSFYSEVVFHLNFMYFSYVHEN